MIMMFGITTCERVEKYDRADFGLHHATVIRLTITTSRPQDLTHLICKAYRYGLLIDKGLLHGHNYRLPLSQMDHRFLTGLSRRTENPLEPHDRSDLRHVLVSDPLKDFP